MKDPMKDLYRIEDASGTMAGVDMGKVMADLSQFFTKELSPREKSRVEALERFVHLDLVSLENQLKELGFPTRLRKTVAQVHDELKRYADQQRTALLGRRRQITHQQGKPNAPRK